MDISTLRTSPQRFLNRELSWLAFNRRVLEEAQNPSHPLFERVRFTSIAARNMEEFYMVRVAGLKAQIKEGVEELSIDGRGAQEQLDLVRETGTALIADMQITWQELRSEMVHHHVRIVTADMLEPDDRTWMAEMFAQDILPLLTPTALDPAHPFPFIPNTGMAIILNLRDAETQEELDILLQIPATLDRFVKLPGDFDRYMLIEKVIIAHIHHIFSKDMAVEHYATFRVIRDSEIEFEEDAEDLVHTFERAVKKRRRGNVIQLSVHHNIDPKALSYLMEQLNLNAKQVVKVHGLVGLSHIDQVISKDKPDLLFPAYTPRFPERIREFSGDCFAAIRTKDIIVHHPYESFDVVVQFLRQAAADDTVIAIKQTLYRTSENSPIVEALIAAAEAGKSVTAMVELKARFDEEANIKWARDMERAGVQVVYGFVNLKTHAKVSLVVRKENEGLRSYVHLGTGNYHPGNALVYTDLSFFTCNEEICQDTAQMFNYMTGYAKPQKLNKLAVSPLNVRETLYDLIDAEITNAAAGKPAQIWAKCNSLLDGALIDKLYEASQAGVQIDLVVRGICTLRPGIKGLSDNIRVKSLVGRFLEHGRVYCFANGAALPSPQAKVFMSSADLMARNLNHRIEAFVPIENETVHAQVLDQIMLANMKDQRQSWEMQEDGSYKRLSQDPDAFSAHEYFMQNPSLSGRGNAVKHAPMPPRLVLKDDDQVD